MLRIMDPITNGNNIKKTISLDSFLSIPVRQHPLRALPLLDIPGIRPITWWNPTIKISLNVVPSTFLSPSTFFKEYKLIPFIIKIYQ